MAIVPPANVLAELAMATESLRLAAPGLRWAGTENWHLTLAFLGEVGEPALAGLSTRLERAARRHPPQRLALAGGGAFPAAARARVLWAGIEADRRALGLLAASVAAGARRAGAAPPDEGKEVPRPPDAGGEIRGARRPHQRRDRAADVRRHAVDRRLGPADPQPSR